MSQDSDEQAVLLAKQGDREAFEMLYRRHAGFAVNLAVRVQGTARDVEDIVHDAFLKAHDKLTELREPRLFKGWLGSIVVSLVRTRLRRRRLLAAVGVEGRDPVELDAIASEGAGPEVRAQLAQVYALLQTLPADERIAWTLRYIERHGLENVALLAGCSLATAKRRISRAQAYLRNHFVASGEEALGYSDDVIEAPASRTTRVSR